MPELKGRLEKEGVFVGGVPSLQRMGARQGALTGLQGGGLWKGCPLVGVDPDIGASVFFDHFYTRDTGESISGGWDETDVQGVNTTDIQSDIHSGAMSIINSTTSGDRVTLVHDGASFALGTGYEFWYEARVAPVVKANMFHFGLVDSGVKAGGVITHGIYFLKDAAETYNGFVRASDVSTYITVGTGEALRWNVLGFHATTSQVDFYLGDVLIGNIKVNIPSAWLQPFFGQLTFPGFASQTLVDWVKVVQKFPL